MGRDTCPDPESFREILSRRRKENVNSQNERIRAPFFDTRGKINRPFNSLFFSNALHCPVAREKRAPQRGSSLAQRSRAKLPSGGCRCGARSFRFGQSCPANWRSRRRKKRRSAVPGKLIGRAGPLSAAKILRCSRRFSPASRRRGSRFFRLPRNAALRPAEGELVLPFPGEKP